MAVMRVLVRRYTEKLWPMTLGHPSMPSNTRAATSPDDPKALSASAQGEWNAHVEAVLRGVAHALNNRAAALSALIQLADDNESPATLRGILDNELERVTGLAASIRAIGTPRDGEEAFAPGDAAAEAMDVLKLHAEQRELSTVIESHAAPPVRARRGLFVRALIVLGANAGRADPRARVELHAAGDALVAHVEGATPAASAFVQEIARAMGGDGINEGRAFRIPTLAALRQREGS